MNRLSVALLTSFILVGCAPSDGEPGGASEKSGKEGAALVDSIYTVDGWMNLEDDYIPRVCTQENGAADAEALKVQAIAARTYVLRSIRDDAKLGTPSEPIENGQQFQAYAKTASGACIEAAKQTRGVVGRYQGQLIIANYVAGSLWNTDGSKGTDPTGTEHWVTYNEGLTGTAVHPTKLSYTARTDNRGCMSQNGSDWLSRQGHDYATILRYFYGADLELDAGSSGGADPGGAGGGCGAVSYDGSCQGDVLTWCENNAVKTFNCADKGKTCGYQDASTGYNCVARPPAQSCADIGYAGYCEGSVLHWCEAGAVKSFDCAERGQSCGYQDDAVGNNCL